MLQTLAQLLGATGVAMGIFYLLYKQIIDKVKLPGLNRKQTFALLIILLLLIWSFAIFVILAQGGLQFGTTAVQNVEGTVTINN